MGNLLYAIAVILVIIWAVSFLAYNVSGGLNSYPACYCSHSNNIKGNPGK